MILTPPQQAKSTITSRLFPPVLLGQNPASKLILLSYSSELACAHGSVARDHVREHGKRLNASLSLHDDVQARNHWQTTVGGYMRSASIQGTVTGMAADGLLIDDPFKGSEDSSSPTIREKVWATYSAAAETRLSPTGWVAIINTPWHPDDLCGRLLNTEPEKWIVLRFPALAEAGDLLGRQPGEPLWPERYPLEWYEDRRRTFELRGQSHVWDALYQCSPTGDGSLRSFPDGYFGVHLYADSQAHNRICKDDERFRVLALDPSKSKTGKQGDYAAFADVTLLKTDHLLVSMHLDRSPLDALYGRAVQLVQQAEQEGRPYRMLIIETNQMQEAVAVGIRDRLALAGLHPHIEMHLTPSDQSKHTRIRISLDALLANKKIHFLGETIGNRLTVQQLKELPNGAHDDGPDALEMACQALRLLAFGTKRPAPTVIRA